MMEAWNRFCAGQDGRTAIPREHTQQELKLIRDMRRRNPKLGIVELWARMRARGYTRCVESLWRVMRREGLIAAKKEKAKKYKPKPYEQMKRPGERVQIDVKVVPRSCIATPGLKLYQYHGDRRILEVSGAGGIRGAKHIFLRRLSAESGSSVQAQRDNGRMRTDGQWL